MKKALFLLSIILFAFSCKKDSVETQYHDPLTRDEAISATKKIWNNYDIVAVSKEIVLAKTAIHQVSGDAYLAPDYDSWVILINASPLSYSLNPYSLLFVNVHSGEYKRIDNLEWPTEIEFDYIKSKSNRDKLCFTKSVVNSASFKTVGQDNRYAVIISGGGNMYSNYSFFWNDCSYMYSTLINYYGYLKSHIYVLMSDGTDPGLDRNTGSGYDSSPTDLDGDGIADVGYSATLSNINSVFNALGESVGPNGQLLVFVTDHGMANGDIVLWNESYFTGTEFSSQLSKLNASSRINILLQECHSGVLIPYLSGQNRTIATSCSSTESAYKSPNNDYGEFVCRWISAMRGVSLFGNEVLANRDSDDKVSFAEAFDYAKENDQYYHGYQGYYEHPQYSSTPSDFGSHYDLYGHYLYKPVLTCPSDISASTWSYCSLSGIPSGCNTTWLGENYVFVNKLTDSTATLKSDSQEVYSDNGVLRASFSYSGVNYNLSKNGIIKWRPGMNFSQTLMNASVSGGTCSAMLNFIVTGNNRNFKWYCDSPSWTSLTNGSDFGEFQGDENLPPSSVWVTFNNPLGESTTLTYNLQESDYQ